MELKPQISIKNRKTGDKHLYRVDQDRLTVGRDLTNDLVLDSKTVSRRHAEILQEGSLFFIRDLKSNNGTLLNEKKLTTKEKTLLRTGDVIQIEDYDLHFNLPSAGQAEDIYEVTDTDLLEVKMVKKLLRAMDKESAPSLEVLEGPSAGTRYVLEERNQEIVIGRDPSCEFSVDSNVISRKHVRIEKHFDTVVLQDLGSKNGTFVNRARVIEKRLQDGDIIHLGTLPLSFRNPQELAFDLSPPKVSTKEESKAPPKTSSEEAPPALQPKPILPSKEARSSGRKKKEVSSTVSEESVSQRLPQSQMEEPQETESDEPGFKLSVTEILAIAVGLIVLIGSIWGILKILK